MNDGRTHEELTELLPGYALDALDAEEVRLVARHLDGCPICRLHLDELRDTASFLAFAAPPAQPGPAVKRALLARAAKMTASDATGGRADTGPPEPSAVSAPPARPAGGAPVRLLGGRMRIALAALAAAVVLALGGWNIALQRRLQHAEEEAAIARLLYTPGTAHSLTDGNPDGYGGPAGFIYADPASNVALMHAYYLPPLPPDKRYQLWLITPSGERDSGGLFTVDANGSAQVLVHAPAPFAKYERVGVTIEPYNGSPGPTSPRVVGGALQ